MSLSAKLEIVLPDRSRGSSGRNSRRACTPCARGQEKSTPIGKIQRLNRAPVNKDVLRVQLPRPAISTLKNGLTLVLLEDHKLPTVAFTMWIRPGQLADPSDLPGLASFTAGMLREGTEHRTSAQIAAEVDSLGATLNAISAFGASYTSVNASGLIGDAPNNSRSSERHCSASGVSQPKSSPNTSSGKKLASSSGSRIQAFSRSRLCAARFTPKPPLSVVAPTKESIEKVTLGRSEEIPRSTLPAGQHASRSDRRFQDGGNARADREKFWRVDGAADTDRVAKNFDAAVSEDHAGGPPRLGADIYHCAATGPSGAPIPTTTRWR